MEKLNYPLAYAPMSIEYPDADGDKIHIGYIPNMCYVVGLKRIFNSDGTYTSKYEVVFVDKIVDFENKKIKTDIPKYEVRYYKKCYVNADYVDDIAFDYNDVKTVCKLKTQKLHTRKNFTFNDSVEYWNVLKWHEKLLIKEHSKDDNYISLELKIGNAKI